MLWNWAFMLWIYYTISAGGRPSGSGIHPFRPFLVVLFLSYCQREALWSILNGK